ncbi:leucine-rich repeat and guanylate kinase domain-containing protein [Rhynchonycteris naso]
MEKRNVSFHTALCVCTWSVALVTLPEWDWASLPPGQTEAGQVTIASELNLLCCCTYALSRCQVLWFSGMRASDDIGDTHISLGNPSNKKTPSGIPAHLVPSPRRLAKLQADGQITEYLSGVQVSAQIPGNQSPAPSQNPELTQEGAAPATEPSPHNHISADPPPSPSSAALSVSQKAQGSSPNQKEGDVQQSDLSSKETSTNLPENEARTSERILGEAGQAPTTPAQGPPRHPDPPLVHRPWPDPDEELVKVKVIPTDSPSYEPLQGPGPDSLDPPRIQDEEPEPASPPPNNSHHDPPREPSDPDGAKMLGPSLGDSQQPLEEGTPKAEVVWISTPSPGLPHPQDAEESRQTQDKQDRAARSRLAPSRLPQPQLLAPLQSRRPTPMLPSPSREGALGTASDQTTTPSLRHPPAPEGDPGKLPPISPPHPKPPQHLSPHPGHSAQHFQELKLPQISPPTQEQALLQAQDSPQEGEAQGVRLPRLPTPFMEPQLPLDMGAHHESRPAKEKQAAKAGRPYSKKLPDMQTSSQNQEPRQQTGARK